MKITLDKGEKVWLQYKENDKLIYIIKTKHNVRDMYYRFDIIDGKFVQTAKNSDPTKLQEVKKNGKSTKKSK